MLWLSGRKTEAAHMNRDHHLHMQLLSRQFPKLLIRVVTSFGCPDDRLAETNFLQLLAQRRLDLILPITV